MLEFFRGETYTDVSFQKTIDFDVIYYYDKEDFIDDNSKEAFEIIKQNIDKINEIGRLKYCNRQTWK